MNMNMMDKTIKLDYSIQKLLTTKFVDNKLYFHIFDNIKQLPIGYYFFAAPVEMTIYADVIIRNG